MKKQQKFNLEIKNGDLFKSENDYFLCGDLEENNFDGMFKYIPKNVRMIYSDPPWNKGNARFWRTYAGVSRDVDYYNSFLKKFFLIVKKINPEYFFMEVPFKGFEKIIEVAKENSIDNLKGNWIVYYGAPVTIDNYCYCSRPNRIICFTNNDLPNNFDPSELKGEKLTDYIFSFFYKENEFVIDPCIGKGMTSRMSFKYKMNCVGMELNPKRLEITLGWLLKNGRTIEKQ